MAHPEYLYWILLALIALPLAAHHRTAGVIVAVFTLSLILVNGFGLPVVPTTLAIHLIALPCALLSVKSVRGTVVAGMFYPLALNDILCTIGMTNEVRWWWCYFSINLAQIIALGIAKRGVLLMPLSRQWRQSFINLWMRLRLALA